ncbi:tetratricopeptide repeat protein [Nocardiopsis sp. NPDC055824]
MSKAREERHSVVNTVDGDTSSSTVIQGRNVHVTPQVAHQVNWPIRFGSIPEAAAHYQHRTIADRLDNDLHSFGTVILRQVISGIGGVGKTQLAAHYARTLRNITDPERRVDVLVWANASTRASITSAYAHASRQLYSTVPEDPEDAAHLFLAWLGDPNKHQNRRWLVVWDDLTDLPQVEDLWPPHDQPHGRVLVTTRRRDHSLTTQGHLIEVDIYTSNEARAFLTQALDTAGIPHSTAELDTLANALGRLPLALGQAVPYMADLVLDCPGYLEVFHDRMTTLEEVFPDWNTSSPLAATWDLSLGQADNLHPRGVARPLMSVIALLDGTGVPEQVLTSPPMLDYLAARHKAKGPRDRPGVSAHQVRTILAGLDRLSLLTRTVSGNSPGRSPHTVRVHQLVQRATREHHMTRPTRETAQTAADALFHAWPEVERDTVLADRLRSNTQALHGRTGHGQYVEKWLWESEGHPVLFWAGRSLGEAGRVHEAVTYWEHMTRAAHKNLRPDHPSTLASRYSLAHWRGETGNLTKVMQALEELLTDQQRALGSDHPHTMTTRHKLAHWDGEAGSPATAAQALEDLLADRLRVLGPDHPDTLATRHNLAWWRGQAGDPIAAAQTYEDLLTAMLRVLGPDHPDTLTTRHDLAWWQGRARGPVVAVTTLQVLLRDRVRVLGPDHPDTLSTRHEVAWWRGRSGDPISAAAALQDLLTDQLRILGPDHPHTLITRANLSRWQGEAGDPIGAAVTLENLLADRVRILGPDHPDTLSTRGKLADWWGEAGDPTAAITAYEDLLIDRLRVLGPDHPHTLLTRHKLALWTHEVGNTAEALKLLAALVQDRRRVLGSDHPDTHTSEQLLQRWYSDLSGE